MDLFSLAPVVFGENGSEIHPPVLFSVRPLLAAAMKRIVFLISLFSFFGPLTFSWRLIDSQRGDRLWPRVCDVNSYDGCASDVRCADMYLTCPDVNLLAWALDGSTKCIRPAISEGGGRKYFRVSARSDRKPLEGFKRASDRFY